MITISGVVGNKVHLPCDIRSADNDEVSMVLWYKEGAGEPIYRWVNNNANRNCNQSKQTKFFIPSPFHSSSRFDVTAIKSHEFVRNSLPTVTCRVWLGRHLKFSRNSIIREYKLLGRNKTRSTAGVAVGVDKGRSRNSSRYFPRRTSFACRLAISLPRPVKFCI